MEDPTIKPRSRLIPDYATPGLRKLILWSRIARIGVYMMGIGFVLVFVPIVGVLFMLIGLCLYAVGRPMDEEDLALQFRILTTIFVVPTLLATFFGAIAIYDILGTVSNLEWLRNFHYLVKAAVVYPEDVSSLHFCFQIFLVSFGLLVIVRIFAWRSVRRSKIESAQVGK